MNLSKKIFLFQFGGAKFKVHNKFRVLNLLSLNSYLTSRVAWGGGQRYINKGGAQSPILIIRNVYIHPHLVVSVTW